VRAVVYCEWEADWWQKQALADTRPGQAPYGLEHLAAASIEVAYWQPPGWLRAGFPNRVRLALELGYGAPFTRSLMLPNCSRLPDVAVSILESQGFVHALLRSAGIAPWSKVPLALVSCWLAETARTASRARLMLLRKIVAGADLIVYWSRNQADLLTERLGVPRDRLMYVPFGVETEFFRPSSPDVRPDGYILAAGRDDGRDYQTFSTATSLLKAEVRVVAPLNALDGLTWSSNVKLLGEVSHTQFRDLLAGASIVVVPSKPEVAYPTGQTVLLNAMATRRPTVVTRTPPLADYARHGENTWTVEPNDPGALAEGIDLVLGDMPLARRIASQGALDVARSFNTRAMWGSIAERLEELVGEGTRKPCL
jgi:glycosyltransferase involved in cell wall biosynthesis